MYHSIKLNAHFDLLFIERVVRHFELWMVSGYNPWGWGDPAFDLWWHRGGHWWRRARYTFQTDFSVSVSFIFIISGNVQDAQYLFKAVADIISVVVLSCLIIFLRFSLSLEIDDSKYDFTYSSDGKKHPSSVFSNAPQRRAAERDDSKQARIFKL